MTWFLSNHVHCLRDLLGWLQWYVIVKASLGRRVTDVFKKSLRQRCSLSLINFSLLHEGETNCCQPKVMNVSHKLSNLSSAPLSVGSGKGGVSDILWRCFFSPLFYMAVFTIPFVMPTGIPCFSCSLHCVWPSCSILYNPPSFHYFSIVLTNRDAQCFVMLRGHVCAHLSKLTLLAESAEYLCENLVCS